MHNVGIFTYAFIPYYASAIHKHTHTPILKLSEDSEPTGLKADIAQPSLFYIAWNDVRIHFTSPGARVSPVKTAMSRIALRINGIQFTSVALHLSHTYARKAVPL